MSTRSTRNVKKSVSFSDDQNLSTTKLKHRHHGHDYDNPPVYVRKTWSLVPVHLLALLYWFICYSEYDILSLLYLLIPFQIMYLVLFFNKNTIYGKKRLRANWPLVIIAVCACVLLAVPCMVLVILFGAPFGELLRETFLLSLHCCFLAYPAVYDVFNCDFKVGYFKKYFIAIAVGCWMSCIVIPLDWDRDWQQWPVPLVVGAYLGGFFGFSFGGFL